ncbi:MAG: hypothetical protein ACOH2K_07110 [Burkholderiaceae bacterium]
MNNDELDASIPVLTEIIVPEQDFAETAGVPLLLLPLPLTARSPAVDDAAESAVPEVPEVIIPAETPPPAISDSQWEALEQQISERVLSQLQTRIDFVLENRIRDGLADALQLTVESMAAEIKRGLRHTLEDVIVRAVAQEVTRLKKNKNKPAEHPIQY